MEYFDVPKIVDVRYLRGRDLLVSFSNGEDKIVDVNEAFEVPASHRYHPISEFRKFGFDSDSIWWGADQDYSIGVDSIYAMSTASSQSLPEQVLGALSAVLDEIALLNPSTTVIGTPSGSYPSQ